MTETKALIILRSALNSKAFDEAHNLKTDSIQRSKQYVFGLRRIRRLLRKTINFDVIWVDNTVHSVHELPEEVIAELDPSWRIFTPGTNKYGRQNKGAGDIETLIFLKNEILKYEYVFYFETRLQIIRTIKIRHIINQRKEYINSEYKSFIGWILNRNFDSVATGCFAVKSQSLTKFFESVDIVNMVARNLSIENLFYEYLVNSADLAINRWGWHSLRFKLGKIKFELY